MTKSYILRALFAAFMIVAASGSSYAVTDREMEEARTIAAKAYLRFANNGSGYLDEVKASNMSDLQKALKAKEKDNIKAFLAIPVPKDYASWDREKLIEYWAVTAMNSNGLIQDGKLAKHRIRKQIGAMQISAPSATPAPAAETAAEVPAAAPAEASSETPAVEEPVADANAQQDILADQKAIEADNQNPSLESGSNNTWIYVVILILLIGVVVWLVVYAAKVMKRQQIAEGPEGASGAEISELRERAKRAIAQHKETIAQLTEKLQATEAQAAQAQAETERYKEDNRRLNDRIAELQERLRNAAAASSAPNPQPKPQPKPQPRHDEILHVIYLGRANSRGIFVRADRNYSAGNTVYRLNTEDGLTGSFEYVDNPAMNQNALEHPKEILSGGCTADDIEDTIGATGIVTESRGTAIFENGYWKVLRKSRIRFK